MGTAKEQLTPQNDETKSLFSRFKKKGKTEKKEKGSENLADHLQSTDGLLDEVIRVKEIDLKSEKGQEAVNRQKLALLRTMRFHLDEVINVAAEYGDVKA
jgi:hypothetical protein